MWYDISLENIGGMLESNDINLHRHSVKPTAFHLDYASPTIGHDAMVPTWYLGLWLSKVVQLTHNGWMTSSFSISNNQKGSSLLHNLNWD